MIAYDNTHYKESIVFVLVILVIAQFSPGKGGWELSTHFLLYSCPVIYLSDVVLCLIDVTTLPVGESSHTLQRVFVNNSTNKKPVVGYDITMEKAE